MISMLCKIKQNAFISIMAAGLLLMCMSAVSIDVVSIAYGYGFDQFDMMTSVSVGDLTPTELMTEFALPVTFVIGSFLTATGMSGWLLFSEKNYRYLSEV